MIKIKIGEQKPLNYTLKVKSTGLPVNLVNSTIVFQIKENENQVDDFLCEKFITETSNPDEYGQIIDAQNGRFFIFLKREDTINLDVNKDYYYTIWRYFGNIKEVISSSGMKIEAFIVCPD
ncbi:MAG: hypothetical protein MJ180_00535 [Candidatus Gastranaerophilales bacterium]|nr:hypothetical protein [Candidatus Gastranaerophilales bacterium]